MDDVADFQWLFYVKTVSGPCHFNDLFLFDIWERIQVGLLVQQFLLERFLSVDHHTGSFIRPNLFESKDVLPVERNCFKIRHRRAIRIQVHDHGCLEIFVRNLLFDDLASSLVAKVLKVSEEEGFVEH